MKSRICILTVFVCVFSFAASAVTTQLGTEWADSYWQSKGYDYKWFVTARNFVDGASDWELACGINPNDSSTFDQSDLTWGPSPVESSFVLTYDSQSHIASWVMDGQDPVWMVGEDFRLFYFQLVAYEQNDNNPSMSLSNLEFDLGNDGVGVETLPGFSVGADEKKWLEVDAGVSDLSSVDFKVTGDMEVTWESYAPTKSNTAMYIKFTTPEPMTIAIMGLGGLVLRRKR